MNVHRTDFNAFCILGYSENKQTLIHTTFTSLDTFNDLYSDKITNLHCLFKR